MAYTRRSRRRSGGGRQGKQLIGYGAVVFAIGLVITIATYAFAQSRGGGSYFISYGPMIIGAFAMIRGTIQVMTGKGSADSQPVGQPAGQGIPGAQPGYGSAPGYGSQPGQAAGDSGKPSYDQAGYAMPRAAAPTAPGAQASGALGTPGVSGAPAGAGGGQPIPANWYPDPGNPSQVRYWDGQAWTPHTQPRQ
jgi:hypothetical protein